MLYVMDVVHSIGALTMFSVDATDVQKLVDCYDDSQVLLHVVSVNLLTLSKITADDYLMTQGELFHIQRPSDYRFIPIGAFRFYYGFSRQQTLSNIKQLYNGAKYLLEKINLTTEERVKLRELILKSHKGLKKLQITYIKDVSTYSELQIILQETSRGVFTVDIMTASDVRTKEFDRD